MNKKTKTRSGLFFGILMALFSIITDLIIKENLTVKQISITIIFGLIKGITGGVLFAWLIGKFLKSKFVIYSTKIDLEEDEKLIFETFANHFESLEGVGGKLYLTNKRLIFKSHKLNIQNSQLSIELPDIIEVDKYKTLGFIDNGISVITATNNKEKFVVEKRRDWLSYFAKYAAV